MAYTAVEQYKMKVASKILTNCDSWIGLTNKQINRIQTVQDNFFKQVFQVSTKGTPLCMIRLDSQTLHIKWQIIMKKIKQVRKTMDKTENNICKSALVAGQNTCAGEDLLNECKAWCNKLNIRCVTRGTDPIPANARADDFKLKKALWAENDKEIRLELDQKKKVKNIVMPNKKIERNYPANLTLSDAKIWFRYRSQILDNIK